jgi:hypothetical protein
VRATVVLEEASARPGGWAEHLGHVTAPSGASCPRRASEKRGLRQRWRRAHVLDELLLDLRGDQAVWSLET